MTKKRILYGVDITAHHRLNFSEQLYDIFVKEIHLGRWEIHDRLPGVVKLANELDLGTKTVQIAYDRMKDEGYLETRNCRGTFLKSLAPENNEPHTVLGLLISEKQKGISLIKRYEKNILKIAREKNWKVELKVLPEASNLDGVNQAGELFSKETIGILSLTPFGLGRRYLVNEQKIPLVFLCPAYEKCIPNISADIYEACRELTAQVIKRGHRKILFSADTIMTDPRQTALLKTGCQEMMFKHKLNLDFDLMLLSDGLVNDDQASVIDYLHKIKALPDEKRPTAIIAGSLGRASAIIAAVKECGIKVPEQLSVGAIGSAYIDENKLEQITGMVPDINLLLHACFDLIEQQKLAGTSNLNNISMRMHYVPGNTLASVNGADDPAVVKDDFMTINDIEQLSEMIQA